MVRLLVASVSEEATFSVSRKASASAPASFATAAAAATVPQVPCGCMEGRSRAAEPRADLVAEHEGEERVAAAPPLRLGHRQHGRQDVDRRMAAAEAVPLVHLQDGAGRPVDER